MRIAHDHQLSDYLGVTKTHIRILRHFFWPELKKDVAQYCHACQLVGKPNQVIPPAKLSHLPVIRESFKHVFVDCDGLLSKTKSGKQFLFTIMCVVARFLEANPLRKITVPIIMLVKFFSTLELPKIVHFLSKLFKQALKSLTITRQFSSVYHLQSQGTLKCFHQTLKVILRKYSLGTAKDWEEGSICCKRDCTRIS